METRIQTIQMSFTDEEIRRIARFYGEQIDDMNSREIAMLVARFVREEIGQSLRELADEFAEPVDA